MKELLRIFKSVFALNYVMSIFDNDAHEIVSKWGKVILNNKNKIWN